MSKKLIRFLLLVMLTIVLIVAFIFARTQFNSDYADAARQLDGRSTQIMETQRAP